MFGLPPLASWSLKTKFALCSGGLMFVFSVAFTSWTLRTMQSDLHASVVDAQLTLVRSTAADIDAKIELRRDAMLTIAPLLSRAAPASGAAMDAFFLPRPVLKKMFDLVFVVDAQGRVIHQIPQGAAQSSVGASLAGRDFFEQLRAGSKMVISRPFKAPNDHAPWIAFAAPLHSATGDFGGALVGLLNASHGNFLGDVGRQHIGRKGYFLLLERREDPLIIMHPQKALIGTPAPDGGHHPIMAAALQAREGSLEGRSRFSGEALRTFVPLRAAPWLIVSVYPVDEAFAGLQARRRQVLEFAASLFVLAAVAAWLLTGWLLRPLGRLREQMSRQASNPGLTIASLNYGSAELAEVVQSYNEQATARSEFEDRMHASEQRLRAITDHLPALIAHVDRFQRYDFLNATFRTWLGIDPAASIGRPMAEVIGAEVYATRLEHVTRCLAGQSSSFEEDVPTLLGPKTLRIEYLPEFASDGSVAGFYTFSADVTELKEAHRQLGQLVRLDSLTGLANRLQFEEALPLAFSRCSRTGLSIALLFLDVDHFKQINDGFGHAAGDQLLREFSTRLKRSVRKTDSVARLGGDEFVIILEGLHAQAEAVRIARNILAEIRRPFDLHGRLLRVTTSVGVVFCPSATVGQDPAALLAQADAALYAAKAAGRDTYRLVARPSAGSPAVA